MCNYVYNTYKQHVTNACRWGTRCCRASLRNSSSNASNTVISNDITSNNNTSSDNYNNSNSNHTGSNNSNHSKSNHNGDERDVWRRADSSMQGLNDHSQVYSRLCPFPIKGRSIGFESQVATCGGHVCQSLKSSKQAKYTLHQHVHSKHTAHLRKSPRRHRRLLHVPDQQPPGVHPGAIYIYIYIYIYIHIYVFSLSLSLYIYIYI